MGTGAKKFSWAGVMATVFGYFDAEPFSSLGRIEMKIVGFAASVLLLAGCASVQPLGAGGVAPLKNCNVKVFSSHEAARANGEIEELCLISGTSSGSFSHTVGTAIQKHKNKACECGADNVYIQAQDPGTLGTASVTLVAFRYKNAKQ